MSASPTHQAPVTVCVFRQRFSSTPLGARLARHLALHRLHGWDIPYGSGPSDTAALLVAELAANAVTHGRVLGRDFELSLSLIPYTLRIDVSDTRGERRPPHPGELTAPPPGADAGRGLLLGGGARRPVGSTRPRTGREDRPRRTGPAALTG